MADFVQQAAGQCMSRNKKEDSLLSGLHDIFQLYSQGEDSKLGLLSIPACQEIDQWQSPQSKNVVSGHLTGQHPYGIEMLSTRLQSFSNFQFF